MRAIESYSLLCTVISILTVTVISYSSDMQFRRTVEAYHILCMK